MRLRSIEDKRYQQTQIVFTNTYVQDSPHVNLFWNPGSIAKLFHVSGGIFQEGFWWIDVYRWLTPFGLKVDLRWYLLRFTYSSWLASRGNLISREIPSLGDIDISKFVLQSGLIILDGGHQSGIGLGQESCPRNYLQLLVLLGRLSARSKDALLLNSCEGDLPHSVPLFITFNSWDQCKAHSWLPARDLRNRHTLASKDNLTVFQQPFTETSDIELGHLVSPRFRSTSQIFSRIHAGGNWSFRHTLITSYRSPALSYESGVCQTGWRKEPLEE